MLSSGGGSVSLLDLGLIKVVPAQFRLRRSTRNVRRTGRVTVHERMILFLDRSGWHAREPAIEHTRRQTLGGGRVVVVESRRYELVVVTGETVKLVATRVTGEVVRPRRRERAAVLAASGSAIAEADAEHRRKLRHVSASVN